MSLPMLYTSGPLQPFGGQGLSMRLRLPLPTQPRGLLVLLHGVGGNETNLAALGGEVDEAIVVVHARGPRALGPDQFGWFRVGFTPSGPQIDADEAEASRRLLVEAIAAFQSQHGLAARDTVVAGFSQGGILSASVALSAPERVAGFGLLCGRILPELAPRIASREDLVGLRAFVGHGREDTKLPVAWAQRAAAQLDTLGVTHETHLYPGGHGIDAAMRDDLLAWLDLVLPARRAAA